VSVKGDEQSRVVGDNPAAVVSDVLLAVGVLVDDPSTFGSSQRDVVLLADRRELGEGLRESLRAHLPVRLCSLLTVGVLDAFASRVHHVSKDASIKLSEEDLLLFGIVRHRLARNPRPHEVVDLLDGRLVALRHHEEHVTVRHASFLNIFD